mmetsp:Transcript_25482/g.37786  ORF Transcript_25482/g.37786 Transcript_25482/m.37786 type:complete len:427 (-) Transcript_25482:1555-2835(-)
MPEALDFLMLQIERGTTELSIRYSPMARWCLDHRSRPRDPSFSIVHILVVIHNSLPSLGNHKPAGNTIRLYKISGDISSTARNSTIACKQSHFSSRNANEIIRTCIIRDLHDIILGIIHDLYETEHFHSSNSRRILKHITPMISIVQIIILVCNSHGRSLHSCRITSDDKVGCSCRTTRFCVELNLSRSSVYHGRRPNCHDRGSRVESSRMGCSSLKHLLMLLHPDIQRNIITLGPPPKRTQPQDRILIPLLLQILPCTPHQIRMPGMSRIPRLKRIHRIRPLFLKLRHEFIRRLAPFIQSIIIFNTIKEFNLPSNQIIPSRVDMMDIRMFHVNRTKHPRDNFLLAIIVYFCIPQNRDSFPHLRDKCHVPLVSGRLFNRLLGKRRTGKSNWDTHANPLRRLMLTKVIEIRLTLMLISISRDIKWIH